MVERTIELETEHAWLQRTGPLVVQRWKPGITLDVTTVRGTMLVRHACFGDQRYAAIVVVPEGTGYAMSFLETDHYQGTRAVESIIAMANVVEEEELRAVVSLYYAQHPPAYVHEVFATMAQAQAWVAQRLAAAAT